LFTAIIPLIYIYWGLKTKNRHLLLTGLGITAIAALTFKNYFSLGHPEILFTAIGTLLIVLSWLFIN
jgi:ERCC4-related helicase